MDPVRQLVATRPRFTDSKPATEFGLAQAQRIHDRIYMSPGNSNAYLVVTDDSRVVINAGMGFEGKLVHKPLFDQVSRLPVSHIITTQGHVDHVGGVAHFREPGTQYIAQASNAACQHDDALIQARRSAQACIWFQSTFDSMAKLAREHPGAFIQDIPTPDLTFDDSYRFQRGGVTFELYSTPGGETVDSCIVWLPQHGILFSGNQFGPLFPHFPNFNTIRGDKYRWVEPYLQSLRRTRDFEPEILITGHFQPVVGKKLIRQCLDRLHDAVEYVFTATLKGMNEGKPIWQLMREVTLPESLYVGQGYGKVSWAVRTLWEAHMGWFKGDLTSELYPTRPHDVMPELVALAGPERVRALAEQKLAAGDPESALLLNEALLGLAPNDSAARDQCRRVHQALLVRMQQGEDNFWEGGWLRHRIAQAGRTQAGG